MISQLISIWLCFKLRNPTLIETLYHLSRCDIQHHDNDGTKFMQTILHLTTGRVFEQGRKEVATVVVLELFQWKFMENFSLSLA